MSRPPDRLPSNYWRQFVATSISNVGDGMAHAAAPLLALSLTNDARLIAGVSFAAFLPWLVLTLPAGVYIDRFNRTFNDHSQRDPRCALFGYWLQRLAGVTDYVVIDVDSARRRLLRSYF